MVLLLVHKLTWGSSKKLWSHPLSQGNSLERPKIDFFGPYLEFHCHRRRQILKSFNYSADAVAAAIACAAAISP